MAVNLTQDFLMNIPANRIKQIGGKVIKHLDGVDFFYKQFHFWVEDFLYKGDQQYLVIFGLEPEDLDDDPITVEMAFKSEDTLENLYFKVISQMINRLSLFVRGYELEAFFRRLSATMEKEDTEYQVTFDQANQQISFSKQTSEYQLRFNQPRFVLTPKRTKDQAYFQARLFVSVYHNNAIIHQFNLTKNLTFLQLSEPTAITGLMESFKRFRELNIAKL